jgi:anhydro-N-acetylmuramic acid kinase
MTEEYNVIGLMSGTSIDGLDIAYCNFTFKNEKWKYKIEIAETNNYSNKWYNALANADKLSALELLLLNNEYGYFIGEKVSEFITKHNIHPDFVASHGHTVFHQPQKNLTYQIGSGECISAKCGLKVVYDFRTMDVALGGQGAPLVPIGDKYLFSEFDYCINLGGFANISFENSRERIAYDICPVNIVLNQLAKKLGFEFDFNGNIAAKGKLNTDLFNQLNNISFYHEDFPKSLGKEWVQQKIIPFLNFSTISIEDKIRTFSEHIVYQLLRATSEKKSAKLIFSGGGTYNEFIINLFEEKTMLTVIIPDKETIDFKEALIFAFLGVLKIRNEINSIQSVTGARKSSSGGKIIII